MRKIKKIIVHCSDFSNKFKHGVKEIDKWHRQRGWNSCGYHYVITPRGIEIGRPDSQQGAHCKYENHDSIGICLTGKDDFTLEQFDYLDEVLAELFEKYGLSFDDVYPHYHFNPNKECPAIDLSMILSNN